MKRRFLMTILVIVMGASACSKPDAVKEQSVIHTKSAAKTTVDDKGPSNSLDGSAFDELASLDHRTAVPLMPMMAWHQKQNMMEHLVAIERITGALAEEKWEDVIKASALIESSPQMQRMCQHMGAGAEGFTQLALDFHSRADEIGVAAKAKDKAKVLRATSFTLQACTSCHARFRQDVVDAETWKAKTGSSHMPSHGH